MESPYILVSTSYRGSTTAYILCLYDASILRGKANKEILNATINNYNFM